MGAESVAFHRAEDAEERGEGICRTCLAPIWNEGGTIDHQRRETGWSDRIERGGDSLVCFRAVEYRHVPLTGREACIYDMAYRRGAGDGEQGRLAANERLRCEVAYLMYQLDQGYLNPIDRAFGTNWLLDDSAKLHRDDAEWRPHLLAMADEVISLVRTAGGEQG